MILNLLIEEIFTSIPNSKQVLGSSLVAEYWKFVMHLFVNYLIVCLKVDWTFELLWDPLLTISPNIFFFKVTNC